MKRTLLKCISIFALISIGLSGAAMAQTKSKLTQILERGTLRVGTTGDFNPMSFKDTSTNSLVGYDIDAMNQLATDMGVKIEFITTEWATLVNGIVSDRYDVFAGGSSLNMARAKTVAFTSPYVYAGTVPLINKKDAKKFTNWESINNSNVNVAVLMGTVLEQQAKSLFKNYPDLQVVGSSADMKNKRPFAYPVVQGDAVWVTFLNNWIALKEAEGFFTALETKWLSSKK